MALYVTLASMRPLFLRSVHVTNSNGGVNGSVRH
jgi:hypothetical protein